MASHFLRKYEFGAWNALTNENKSTIASVPEPNFALGALTFAALSVGLRRKRKHKLAPSPVNQYDSVRNF
ncbi:hypothetical protein KBT16_08970 [Nostoc sp. CCCryo 231-06]|nr:hypothetical protein [Nostoc sp. CCCryo 231-06]